MRTVPPHTIEFQSTLSVRRATLSVPSVVTVDSFISIHALREESDRTRRSRFPLGVHFNPRSP